MASPPIFRKVLSLNDTGETGAHVAGLLVPKMDLDFFPRLNPGEKNPRAEIIAVDQEGAKWPLNFIYYNNESFGGTRNEYRLTGLTAFFAANGLRAGDVVALEKTSSGFRIWPEKRTDSAQPQRQQWLGLGGGSTISAQAPEQTFHNIRPAARIVHTIGQNLIKDAQAAVIELVKNSYDADAHNVFVRFKAGENIRITVEDDGHGMTFEQVTSTWLVPATPDKAKRPTSPGGRQMQGNKGIGRFASFVLGEEIFLRTVAKGSDIETSLLLQSSDFRSAQFLDEVSILVEKRRLDTPHGVGTQLEMTAKSGDEVYRTWAQADFQKLRLNLRRMLFPLGARDAADFRIWLITEGFGSFGQPDGEEEIESLPVMDQFDYRIFVEIDSNGFAKGVFQSPLVVGKPEEPMEMSVTELPGASCGPLQIDLRVIDREAGSLQDLIDRSRMRGDVLGDTNRTQFKRMLDDACGVLVFRGEFRIRPYGDKGDDWLGLDRERINNPAFAISNNQTFGVISIAAERESHLEEKSARDGLREDEHYERLRAIIKALILELQGRRFAIRRSIGRIQRTARVGEMLSELRDYEKPIAKITAILKTEGLTPARLEKVEAVLRDEQKNRELIVARLEETIAIYQGQATLGKVVGIVLHEGNRGIGILKTQSRRIPELIEELRRTPGPVLMDEIIRTMEGIRGALMLLTELFDRIQPLGVRSRAKKSPIRLISPINDVLRAFEQELNGHSIKIEIEIPDKYEVIAWENDLKAIFFNLVENSIYWLTHPPQPMPKIVFNLETNNEGRLSRLHVQDNGPGIPKQHVANEDIFEPHFSLRQGVGLGLPIAGEAATRNGFSLKAIHSEAGAHFVLDFSPPPKNDPTA